MNLSGVMALITQMSSESCVKQASRPMEPSLGRVGYYSRGRLGFRRKTSDIHEQIPKDEQS